MNTFIGEQIALCNSKPANVWFGGERQSSFDLRINENRLDQQKIIVYISLPYIHPNDHMGTSFNAPEEIETDYRT